ncbi:hypothetical protein V5N11_007692 [Cardamine amara subsp. amara]|uniref:Endonuclease/exonuclease/phosphatase domain-containing protein n=1 Tax=Cardamine amara subsp. amara TaxID=228776 RepID=A0ABD0ZXV1_CARAN
MSQVCQDWSFTSNHASDEDDRIILIWKHLVVVQVLNQSRQSLTCEVTLSSKKFIYTAVYASNHAEDRTNLWIELLNLQTVHSLSSLPWLVGGDFNQIIHPAEHSNPAVNSFSPAMLELRDCLLQLGLFDLRYQGSVNTWINNRPAEPIAKKLDRVLVNQSLISCYQNSFATFLPPDFSDHCPSLVNLAYKIPQAGNKPFKFFNFLTTHPNFCQTVENAWIQTGSYASNLTTLCWKLKSLKRPIKSLNRENFSNIQERVILTNQLLQSVQVQALQTPSLILFQKERDLHKKWLFLRTIEEAFLRQKSRINWLKEGDQTTTFFYRMCQVRMSYNGIRSFTLPSGLVISDPLDMSLLAVAHFKGILAPTEVQVSSATLH